MGVTRARRRLYLSHAWRRTLWGTTSHNIPAAVPLRGARPSWSTTWGVGRGRGGRPQRAVGDGRRRARRRQDRPGPRRWASPPGDQVVHDRWGDGVVVSASGEGDGAQAEVRFASVGAKKLLLSAAPAAPGLSSAWPSPRVAPPIIGRLMKRPYRVVVAKPGLDGHDRGAKVIARALRDAGFEVVYTGLHQTPEQVVQAVVQEDADAVGLSLLSGAHLTLVPRVIDGLGRPGVGDVLVIVGGIIPDGDIPGLTELGVAEVFTPGSPLPSIGQWLADALDRREEALGA